MRGDREQATVLQAASVCLQYPDENLRSALPVVRRAVEDLPDGVARERLLSFLDSADATTPFDHARHYVGIFDTRRRCCVYLTWWRDGDTRTSPGTSTARPLIAAA